MKLKQWLASWERNEVTWWTGLVLLFAGLAWGVSIATALTVVGAAIAGESLLTSYIEGALARGKS